MDRKHNVTFPSVRPREPEEVGQLHTTVLSNFPSNQMRSCGSPGGGGYSRENLGNPRRVGCVWSPAMGVDKDRTGSIQASIPRSRFPFRFYTHSSLWRDVIHTRYHACALVAMSFQMLFLPPTTPFTTRTCVSHCTSLMLSRDLRLTSLCPHLISRFRNYALTPSPPHPLTPSHFLHLQR